MVSNAVTGGVVNPNAGTYTWAPSGGSQVFDVTNTANFTLAGSTGARTYASNNNLVFGNTGAGTVTVTGSNIIANSLLVTNTGNSSYVFTSQPGLSIAGVAALIKNGNGTLTLSPNPASGLGGLSGTGTNLFGGGVIVNAGTVQYFSDSALGGGPVTIGGFVDTNTQGGTLRVSLPAGGTAPYTTTPFGLVAARNLIIGSIPLAGSTVGFSGTAATSAITSTNPSAYPNVGAVVTVDSGVTAVFSGGLTVRDAGWYNRLVKTGPGTLDIQAPTFIAPSGLQLGVTGGTLQIDVPSGQIPTYVAPEWSNSTTGNVVITGNARLVLLRTDRADGNQQGNMVLSPGQVGAPTSTGTITFTGNPNAALLQSAGIVASHTTNTNSGNNSSIWAFGDDGNGSPTIVIDLNLPVRLAGVNGQGDAVQGKYVFGADARGANGIFTNYDVLNINRTIFGNGDVYFATGTAHDTGYAYQLSGGQGLVNVNTTLTYSGNTYIGLDRSGTVRLNVDNAFPASTRLAFGDDGLAPSLDVGALDLNGRTLTVGSIDLGPRPRDPALGRGFYAGLTNGSSTPANIILTGVGTTADYTGQVGSLNQLSSGAQYNFAVGNPGVRINITTGAGFSGTQTFSGSLAQTGTIRASSGYIRLNTSWDAITNADTNAQGDQSTLAATGTGVIRLNPNNATNSYAIAVRLATIEATNGGVVRLASTNRAGGNLPSVAVASTVNLTSGSAYTGFLDLSNNDLIVTGQTPATVRAAVAAWYNGGTNTATGIGSSYITSAAMGTTLAVFGNVADVSGTTPFFSGYDGITNLPSGATIVKYTYFGDTNLDGIVNGTDLANIIEGLSLGSRVTSAQAWAYGDFNYDGVTTLADLSLYYQGLAAFGTGGSLGNGSAERYSLTGAVPEPSAVGVVMAGAAVLTRRRRTAR